MSLRTVRAVRYVQPFREGGSLPILAEGEDGKKFVVKMRGAGQGPLALVAEIVAGEMARSLGLRVPEVALIELDAAFGRNEPDAEIQDLFKKSTGLNVGLEYLSEATIFDAAAGDAASVEEASRTVWLDAFLMNVDRMHKNPNLLMRDGELWLIDHGASMYFHHDWETAAAKASSPFALSREHVLLRWAADIEAASAVARERLTEAELRRILLLVPPELAVGGDGKAEEPEMFRGRYMEFLLARLGHAARFEEEIERVRTEVL